MGLSAQVESKIQNPKTKPPDTGYVRNVARRSGSNFYFSFFSLPKEKREAITAVYAFCRKVDDAVDDPAQKDPSAEVSRWRGEIARTYEGHPSLELTRSLWDAIQKFDLTRAYFDGILDGVAMDLERNRYATFDELLVYCGHVAGEVGLLCMEIFGYRSDRLKEYARKLGIAFQLTNILRDIKTDSDRGRIYLPQEDLKRFHVEESDLLARRMTPHFQRLMTFEANRARAYYQEAAALPMAEERPALVAAEMMRAVYENILVRIEGAHFDVFGERIRVPTPVKLWLSAQAWWRCR